jgi:hypothetical protein
MGNRVNGLAALKDGYRQNQSKKSVLRRVSKKMIRTLPIIRHIRWLYWSLRFYMWCGVWSGYFGVGVNSSDIEHLNGIRDGKW